MYEQIGSFVFFPTLCPTNLNRILLREEGRQKAMAAAMRFDVETFIELDPFGT
jgi:hypothetical protein